MSKDEEIIDDLIEIAESSIKIGFKKEDFIKKFRSRIEKYIADLSK